MPGRHSVKAMAAACAAAATAAGCSTGVEAGDADHAAAAVETVLALCAKEDGTALLHVLNVPAQRALLASGGTTEGCARVLGVASEPGQPSFAGARVVGVRADGGLAEVEIEGATGWRTTVEAEDVGDNWLVTNTRLRT